jgi:hypothetical protein
MMNLVDVGDEEDLIRSKITGIPQDGFHLTSVIDQMSAFAKLPSCCGFILGLDHPDSYEASLEALRSRTDTFGGVYLIRQSPLAGDSTDQEVDCLSSQFEQISLEGVFVSRSRTNSNRLSYVDIVQKPPTGAGGKVEKSVVFPSLGTRKVSNASTVSTQAEDDWCIPVEETKPRPSDNMFDNILKNRSPEDLGSVISDYSSDLSHSTSKRKKRMDGRRKDTLAKKLDIGLLATIPCPSEEPDRSWLSIAGLIVRILELYSQSPRETLQQILSFSVSFFCLPIFS